MDVTIGLDVGTTSCKAVVLTPDGSVVLTASGRYALYTPRAEWAEQDADEIWRVVMDVLAQLSPKLNRYNVLGLGLSGAMHSLLPVQDDGAPLCRAMTWADGRAADQTAALRHQIDTESLYQRTGCPLQPIYHLPRLRWLQEQGIQGSRFVGIKDWVLYRLTGSWLTDVGMASTTGLLDIHRLDWDEEALALAAVTAEQLPTLTPPQRVVGNLKRDIVRATGLPEGLPVIAGNSDGGLANVGAGVVKAGQVVITIGTSGAVRQILTQPRLDTAGRTWCYVLAEGCWFAGGAINNGGLALDWIQRGFYSDLNTADAFARLFEDASRIPPGADGVLLLPYFAGERSPHWQPAAAATLHGLRLSHDRMHVARAVLEGVAFCLADVWQVMNPGRVGEPVRLTGQIAQSPVWAQIIADVLGIPVTLHNLADASAVGAARVAQWGVGLVPTLADLAMEKYSEVIEPDARRHELYQAIHERFQSLFSATGLEGRAG